MRTYRELTHAVAKRRPEMLEMIGQLVQVESPTEDRAAVNRCVALLEKWIRNAGARAAAIDRRQLGIC